MAKPDPRDPERPPPPDAARGLDEVERALSVLDGRHPEHHRAMRETAAAVEERRAKAAKELAASSARSRKKAIIVASGVVAALAVGAVVVGLVRRASATGALLAQASAPWEARGWAVVASSGLSSGARLEATVDPGCIVVVSTVDGALAAERGNKRVEGKRSIGWCSCEKEQVVATTSLAAGAAGGMRVLRIEGSAIGGAKLFASSEPRPSSIGPGGEECAEASLDEWLASGRRPPAPADDTSIEGDGPRAALRRAGFHVVAAAPASAAFVVATVAQGSCALAESTSPSDGISLRATGGARVASSKGALAWCDAAGATYSVWREGGGELRVLTVPSKRVGGMMGVIDAAAAAGVDRVATWTRPDDRAADAADALRASFVADVVASPDGTLGATGAQEKRVVAVSREPDAEVIVTSPAGAYYLCSPPLDPGVTHALCIESAPHSWRPRGGAKIGVASAPMPFWMSSFAPIHEPDALNGALTLLALARRLGADGFTPTFLGGATETAKGVDVLGRAGEDAIVAVGLQPKAPWLVAYTNGAAWDLAGAPVIVPLAPFAHALLTTTPPPTAPKEVRRTVVFRHAVPKP